VNLDRPIILVGTQRSGTTWLGRAFSQSPEVAYWPEPRPVWVYRHWFRPDDVLTAADATDPVKDYISRRFGRFVARHGAHRFCEKTPGNCLRIPFIHAVFPDARFVLILRDGRAVFRSTNQMRAGGPGWIRIAQRIRESSVVDYLAYVDRLPWLARKLMRRPLPFWGVRPPGWKEWLRTNSPHVVVARQWASTICRAIEDFEQLPENQKILIRYEDLTRNPAQTFDRIQAVVRLEKPKPVRDYLVGTADPARSAKWKRELPPDLLAEIRPYLEPTFRRLGYAW